MSAPFGLSDAAWNLMVDEPGLLEGVFSDLLASANEAKRLRGDRERAFHKAQPPYDTGEDQ